MKILVLVMSHRTDDPGFNFLKSLWDSTIDDIKRKKYHIDVLFLYSDSNLDKEYEVINNELITRCEENYWDSLLIKAVNGFDYFMKNDYDLVFKTNLSTLLNLNNFHNSCENILKSTDTIYHGVVGKQPNYKFVSGAGMLLNKKTVNIILDHKSEINSQWTDDIFFGHILNEKHKIEPKTENLNRYDLINVNQNVSVESVKNATHIRIKIRKDTQDIDISNQVYNILKEI